MPHPSICKHLPGSVRHHRPPRLRAAAAALVAGAGFLFAACGGAPSAVKDPSESSTTPPSTTSIKPQSTTTTTAPPITTPTVLIGGKLVTVPTDDGGPITPLQDSGQNVVLTTKGFLPRVLYTGGSTSVVYTNLTPRSVTISFLHSPGTPPVTIAPGAKYAYTPRADQYEYSSSTGYAGYVVVGAFTTS